MKTNVKNLRLIYFVGIKGVAMTSLSLYCKSRGISVMGSDIADVFPTDELLYAEHIPCFTGFDEKHLKTIDKPDLVIYTGAHGGRDNVEVQEALKHGIPVMPHGQALGMFMDGSVQVSVAGSHGKTTTSAMIATILSKGGYDPSYAIGCGEIRGLGASGHFGKGSIFISEADEYVTDPQYDKKPRFLWQKPHVLVVTNIDFDHPDVYKDLKAVKKAFVMLQKNLEGKKLTVVNADDRESQCLLGENQKVLTYGRTKSADIHLRDIVHRGHETTFTVCLGSDTYSCRLTVPGVHNVMNAGAAIACTHTLGVPFDDIREGLLLFGGTKRRFEYLGETNGITVYDDYAHHPHEIESTLMGAREWFPKKRIIAIFQPHTYSRTQALLSSFATCFTDSDIVYIGDIYASAREKDTHEVSSEKLVSEIKKHHPHVLYTKNREQTIENLRKECKRGDILICMGAGDIYNWGGKIVEDLRFKI